jgi:hypothetical protein
VKAIMIDERRFFRTNLVLMQRRKENGAGAALKKNDEMRKRNY